MRSLGRRAFLLGTGATIVGCAGRLDRSQGVPSFETPVVGGDRARFAVIGDYGRDGPDEADVADLVAGWKPDFVITLGDNNYRYGRRRTIDRNIGRHYHRFIGDYDGSYGRGADRNRFFPTLGNHDWKTRGAEPYRDYLRLPGNERYYDFQWGPVHLVALDSDPKEPDGIDRKSIQAQWARGQLERSNSPWKIVYMHHAPYSSGSHGSQVQLQWPYKQWGADLVLAGHDHHYERLEIDGLTYVVNGLGGHPRRYQVRDPIPGSQMVFREAHGAMLIEADATQLRGRFVTIAEREIDQFVLPFTSPK